MVVVPNVRSALLLTASSVTLTVIAPAVAGAATALQPDPAWHGAPVSAVDGIGREHPVAVDADANRVWTLGTGEPTVGPWGPYVIVQRPDGRPDAGFSGDGMLTVAPVTGQALDRAIDLEVLPNGDAAILGLTDADPNPVSVDDDLYLLVLRPDGTPDPAFSDDGLAVVPHPGEDGPRRLAYDAANRRFLVTGWASTDLGPGNGWKTDTFVAAVGWDGKPQAGFGAGGFRVLERSPSGRDDFGDAIVPLADGRIATWVRWEVVDALGTTSGYQSALRVMTAAGADAPSFSEDGDLPTGQVSLPGGLAEVGGRLVGVGSRSLDGASSDGVVVRVGLDGAGLTQQVLDVVSGVPESFDDLAVAADGALLAGGGVHPINGGRRTTSALAVRLSAVTLAPLEAPFVTAEFSTGTAFVAPAPTLAGGIANGVVLASEVNPQQVADTQTFRVGPGQVSPIPGPSPAAPVFRRVWATRVVFSPASWSTPVVARSSAAARKGTVFNFSLDRAATVTIAIRRVRPGRAVGRRCLAPSARLRAKPACRRRTTVVTLTRRAHRGVNKVPFSARIRRRALSPGRHQAVFTPKAGRAVGRARTVAFSIVRG